jgi:protein-S-isoprenylcysteine O-methyltransferase Ste14
MTGTAAISILVLAAYSTLLLELVVFPIPSEASTYQLFFEDAASADTGPAIARARGRSWIGKTFLYLLPTSLGVVLFLVPPVAVLFPAVIEFLWPLPALQTAPVAWAGGILVVLGRSLTFSSVLQLRGMHEKEGRFAGEGLFRFSRNPGLVGMYAFYLGNCLLFPCVVLYAGFVPYVLNMHKRVRMEESQLTRRLGEEYEDYLRRVPRYFKGAGR